MSYLGDFRLGDTFDLKFVTTAAATGAPTQLAGTPVISAYPGNSTTQITAGITLSVDFDSVTGLNNVRVVASSGNGYATATNYQLVITTGTVGGTSAVGYVVGQFSIENRSALMPTTAARTLDVTTGGEAGLDVNNMSALAVGPNPALGIAESGTMQSGSTGTTAVLRSATSFGDDNPLGYQIWITGGTGVGQTRFITAWVSATDTATVATWEVTPDNTSTYIVFPSAAATGGGGGGATAQEVWEYATRVLTAGTNINGSTFTAIPWNAAWDAEVQSECTDALNAYDPPTNAEMDARTIAAADYATAANLATVDTVVDAIKVKTDQLTFTVTGEVDANSKSINDEPVLGDGTSGNLWRGS